MVNKYYQKNKTKKSFKKWNVTNVEGTKIFEKKRNKKDGKRPKADIKTFVKKKKKKKLSIWEITI